MQLFRVILPVDSIDQAASFYAELLGFPGERVSPGRHYFNCGGTILACYDPVADGDGRGNSWHLHFNQYCYFSVEDLEAVLIRARNLGCRVLDNGISDMPWGERLFYALDPFGNPICFVDSETLFTGSGTPSASGRQVVQVARSRSRSAGKAITSECSDS